LSTVDGFTEYQLKKRISDLKEEVEAKANTEISIKTYAYFGCSGPITERQKAEWLKSEGYLSKQDYTDKRLNYYFGHLVPRKGNNMNDINTEAPVGDNYLTISDVKNFRVNDDGSRTEILADGSDGETSFEEATVFIAEDHADHAITIH
jgi:hypothetical protein